MLIILKSLKETIKKQKKCTFIVTYEFHEYLVYSQDLLLFTIH